ncbi:MAG: phenylacetate--CoA ligase family protein, partial [Paludibacteraceae bacterium]|nr:phenylacetate--CoA ligase family protein [Paludibacteraceae bacterium]
MDIEFQTREEIKRFQEELLRKQVAFLAAHSAYYQRVFEAEHIQPESIRTLEDLHRLPFTEKKDLQLYNRDFLCCPREDIIDFVTTSGTLGDPVTFGCTEKDLQRLAYNERKSFACAGVGKGNVVQLMTTIDKRFMAGMAYFLGLRELGAGVIRVGNGIPELQWDTIKRLQPDTLMCVPSFILRLIEYAEANHIDYRHSSVRRIIGIGEDLRLARRNVDLPGVRIRAQVQHGLLAVEARAGGELQCSRARHGHVRTVEPRRVRREFHL